VTDFSNLDRADRWMGRVADALITRIGRAGAGAWNHAPEHQQARARGAGLLHAASQRRDREMASLVRAGVPEGVVRARVRLLARDRDSRPARTPSPASRASR
jgi:hypothetical protein